jgi:uncharacterized protein (TIGR00299 family) protein
MKIAYLDCFSGISGDMFLGALLDTGFPFHELNNSLRTLPIDGYSLEIKHVERNQVYGTQLVVKIEEREQISRKLEEVRTIIERGNLSRAIKDKSIEVFECLAKAEGDIHKRSQEEVHFHEIGAVDSIIDIVGTVYAIDHLKIRSLYVSPLPLGSGFAETAHGRIPIPAPATIALLRGIPVFDSGLRHELVTPTGAALVKCLAKSFGPMPPMVVHEVGYGTGTRHLPDRPNLLRVLIGREHYAPDGDTVVVLETNLDDTSPEWLGFIMDRLFDAGALDVIFCPVQMKKNRPGVQIQVIGSPDKKDILMEILFRESTTLGIRFRYSQRKVLKRSTEELSSPWGKIRVKKVMTGNDSFLFLPEYESCSEIALRENIPLREVFAWVAGLNK